MWNLTADRRQLQPALLVGALGVAVACDPSGPADHRLPDGRYEVALSEPTPTGPCLFNGENCEFPDWLMSEPVVEIRKHGTGIDIVRVDGGPVAEGRYLETPPDHSPAIWILDLYPGTDHERRHWQVRGETSTACDAGASWWFDDVLCFDAWGDPYACGKKVTSVTLSCGITAIEG